MTRADRPLPRGRQLHEHPANTCIARVRMEEQTPARRGVAPRIVDLPETPALPALPITPCQIARARASPLETLEAAVRDNAAIPHRHRCLVQENVVGTRERGREARDAPGPRIDHPHMWSLPHAHDVGHSDLPINSGRCSRGCEERIRARGLVESVRHIRVGQVLRTTPPRPPRAQVLTIRASPCSRRPPHSRRTPDA